MKFIHWKPTPLIRRLSLMLGVLLLMTSFHQAYVSWLVPVYGYLGFIYPENVGLFTVFGYCLGVLPALWMPIALTRPSQFLHWAIYLSTYVPSMLVVDFVQLRPRSELISLQVALLCGFIIIGLSYQVEVFRLRKLQISSAMFWTLIAIATLGLFGRVVIVYWGNFQLVSWKEAYDIRFSGSDIALKAGLAYPINWLSFVFLPVLMAIGLTTKRPWLFVLAVIGTLLLYATQGMKHILFSGLYIWGMYLLLRRRSDVFGLRIVWCVALLIGSFSVYVAAFSDLWSEPIMLFGANFVLRIFGNNGLLMASYHNFFSAHPLTYYSYVTGVNWFVPYPYQYPLGMEISIANGADVLTGSFNNQNAGFWATDGIGAIGLPGIIVISLLIALVFYCLDSVSSSHKPSIVALFLSQYVLMLINTSFFTSLITGGLVFFFLVFYLMPPWRSNASV